MKWYNEILNKVKTLFNMSTEATESEVHEQLSKIDTINASAADEARIRQEVSSEFSTQFGELEKQVERLNQTITTHEATIKDLEQKNANQTTEIETLKKEPAAEHTQGSREATAVATDKPWMKLEINQRRVVAKN